VAVTLGSTNQQLAKTNQALDMLGAQLTQMNGSMDKMVATTDSMNRQLKSATKKAGILAGVFGALSLRD
jgi:hypothetical protein